MFPKQRCCHMAVAGIMAEKGQKGVDPGKIKRLVLSLSDYTTQSVHPNNKDQ